MSPESGNRSRPCVKIYGERNTGTNYLRRLLEENLDVIFLPGGVPPIVHQTAIFARRVARLLLMGSRLRMDEVVKDVYFRTTFARNLGWKHACAPSPATLRSIPIAAECLLITLSKNPYSWLLSLYHRPHHLRIDTDAKGFLDFLTSSVMPLGRENYSEEFETPIAVWNEKTGPTEHSPRVTT